MLNSKQRAILRSEASHLDAIFQVGKGGVGGPMCASIRDALEARELIKVSVLENADGSTREIAEQLAAAVDAEVVGVIGRKLVLYKRSEKEANRKYSALL